MASSLGSVITNYNAVWEEAMKVAKDSETRARITGVQHCMFTFEYFFGVKGAGAPFFSHFDSV